MASLQSVMPGGFDAAAVEPQQSRSYDPLPAGPYDVEITNAEVKDLKSGKGTGLQIEYTVVSPSNYSGRKVFQNLNIKHENEQAEQIAQSQLSGLCRAVGIGVLRESDDLFQKMLRVQLKIRPAREQYAASNDVTGYEALGTTTAPAKASTVTAAPAATKAKAPWQK